MPTIGTHPPVRHHSTTVRHPHLAPQSGTCQASGWRATQIALLGADPEGRVGCAIAVITIQPLDKFEEDLAATSTAVELEVTTSGILVIKDVGCFHA